MTPGSVRTQQYRLVNRDDAYELYDMIVDPGQQQDIADRHPDITKRLASAYEAQAQWDFGVAIMTDFGFDFDRGRQDRSAP